MRLRNTLLLTLLLAVVGLYASPAKAQSSSPGPFFDDETFLGFDNGGNEAYYLQYFNTFTYDQADSNYVYKYNFGWLYYLGNSGPIVHDAYFYDFTSDDYFWTNTDEYPYFYSFNLGEFLYYFEGTSPREFYDFGNDQYILY